MTVLFELGNVEVTAGASEALERNDQKPREFLWRHLLGDWGNVPSWIADANTTALARDKRIMSSYRMNDGQVLWVVTDSDRSSTRVLLPWESVLTAAAPSLWRAGWASFWRYSSIGRAGWRTSRLPRHRPVLTVQ